MADCKNFAEKDMAKLSFEESDQGNSSLGDPWELVGSPSSPCLVTELASEAAMGGASCSSRGLPHDGYFSCPSTLSKLKVLPFSTAMAAVQSEGEACLPTISDALVSQDALTEHENSIQLAYDSPASRTDDRREALRTTYNGVLAVYDDSVLNEHVQLATRMCLDVNAPFCMFLEDDIRVSKNSDTDDAALDLRNGVLSNHDDLLPAVSHLYEHASEQLEAHNVNPADASTDNDSVMETGCNAFTLSVASEASTASHATQAGLIEEHCSSSDDGNSPAILEGADSQLPAQVENSRDTRVSLMNTGRIRHFKVYACASWLWNHLCRWQAQHGYANYVWSVGFAAALLGILVLRRGLQRLQVQNYSLRSQLWAKEKRITQLMLQLMQTKEASAKVRRVPVICTKPALQITHGQV